MYIHLFYKLNFLCLPFFKFHLISLGFFSASLGNVFSEITSLIVNFWILGFKTSKASTCFFPCYLIVSICFLSALQSGEYVNLACFIILL